MYKIIIHNNNMNQVITLLDLNNDDGWFTKMHDSYHCIIHIKHNYVNASNYKSLKETCENIDQLIHNIKKNNDDIDSIIQLLKNISDIKKKYFQYAFLLEIPTDAQIKMKEAIRNLNKLTQIKTKENHVSLYQYAKH